VTGIEASTPPPPLPRWFGPRASPDDPAVSALIARVARGTGWADIGGAFNLNVRIDAGAVRGVGAQRLPRSPDEVVPGGGQEHQALAARQWPPDGGVAWKASELTAVASTQPLKYARLGPWARGFVGSC
jgi:hypothetical protein